jgi:hypothetical protein
MVTATPIQNNFTSGEISPLLYGRPELDDYKKGLKLCLNWLPLVHGGLTARPGTEFIREVKTSSKITRLLQFQFSTIQSYVVEMGDQYFRFYRDKGVIESTPGVPYEIASPHLETDIMAVQYIQSADVIYLTHTKYAPRKLSRTGDTSWTLTTITFLDGPYLPINSTATTLTPSATTGSITITASTALFAAGDVDRLIRIKHGTTWGYARITVFNSPTSVTATVVNPFGATTPTADWRLGLYYTNNFPKCAAFFGDRLYFAGCPSHPQRIDGSVVSDYENFQPTAKDSVLTDSDAVSFNLNASDVDTIQTLSDNRRGLVIFTASSEWVLRANSFGEAITYRNIFAERSSTAGAASLQAIRSDDANIFVQNGGRAIREIGYSYETDGYIAPDRSLVGEHLFRSSIIDLAFQKKPIPYIWFVKQDGGLINMIYSPSQEVLGFSRHELGGVNTQVKAVATIPSAVGDKYQLWLIVSRTINGSTKQYIEVINDVYDNTVVQEEASFLDSSLTYSGAATTTVSGLGHLEGQTVGVLANGATHPNKVVTGGAITLDWLSTVVQVGLNYNSDLGVLPAEVSFGANLTSQGLKKNIHKTKVRVLNTNGLQIGGSMDTIYRVAFREFQDIMGVMPPLFTGDVEHVIDTGYDEKAELFIRRDQPFPATILAIMPRLKVTGVSGGDR